MKRIFSSSSGFGIFNEAPLRQRTQARPQNTISMMNYWPSFPSCRLCSQSSYIMAEFKMTGDAPSLFRQGNGRRKQPETHFLLLSLFVLWNPSCSLHLWLIRRIQCHGSIRASVIDPGIRPGDPEGIGAAAENTSPSFVLGMFRIVPSLARWSREG